ncbi:MAG: permease [Oligosphaeraceae bacterium]
MLGFIEDEVLGMGWLERAVGRGLTWAGVDVGSRLGGSLHFFLYDSVKILVLLCVLIYGISLVQSYFPPERSRRILGGRSGLAARVAGALLGTVTPFCSCSSIPLFMGFVRAGIPLGVTFSFLISSPMVDLGSLVLLASIFGWRVSVAYVVLGLVIAVVGGSLIGALGLEGEVEGYVRGGASGVGEASGAMTLRERCRYAWGQVLSTAEKVYPYVLVGVAVGAFIHNWIPEELVMRALGGGNPLGVALATLCGVPMYADIFGTIPVAEALLGKGARLGVVLSFMMAVTTLSLPSLVLLRRVVRPRLLWLFIAICTLGIMVVGYVFNAIQPLLV